MRRARGVGDPSLEQLIAMSEEIQVFDIGAQAIKKSSGIPVQKSKKKSTEVFTGSDAIEWFTKRDLGSKSQAIAWANKAMELDFIRAISSEQKKEFIGGPETYFFTEKIKSETVSEEKHREMVQAMFDSDSGVEVKDRTYHFKSFKKCFVASRLVDWLIEREYFTARSDCVTYANQLVADNLIGHVHEPQPFKDSSLFFRFNTEEVEAYLKRSGELQSETAIQVRNSRFVQMLANGLGDALISVTEAKSTLPIMLTLDAHNLLLPSIFRDFSAEIDSISDPTTIGRSEIFYSKMVIAYFKVHDTSVLPSVKPFIPQLLDKSDEFDISPNNANLQRNLSNLRLLIHQLLSDLASSAHLASPEMRTVLCRMSAIVEAKFERYRLLPVVATIFLRYLNPAILFPDKYDLLPRDVVSLTNENQLAFKAVGKLMQTIVNQRQFKESHLIPLNDFVGEMSQLVSQFCSDLISEMPDETQLRKILSYEQVNSMHVPALADKTTKCLKRISELLQSEDRQETIDELVIVLPMFVR